jgi:hypothetical protein
MYMCVYMHVCMHIPKGAQTCLLTCIHTFADGSEGDKTNALVGRPNVSETVQDDDDDTAGMFQYVYAYVCILTEGNHLWSYAN